MLAYTFQVLLLISSQSQNKELLKDGGFERSGGWSMYEGGYKVNLSSAHSGLQSIECSNANGELKLGAVAQVVLNQTSATPVVISGWSKAREVEGSEDADYSIYVDAICQDGSVVYGRQIAFSTGTHEWEKRQLLLQLGKPVKSFSLYALFRGHKGTAWFDDFSAKELNSTNIFDGQILPPPSPRSGSAARYVNGGGFAMGLTAKGEVVSDAGLGGFLIRDVATEGTPRPMTGNIKIQPGDTVAVSSSERNLHINLAAKIIPVANGISVEGKVSDATGKDRAVTLYFALPVNAVGWNWGQDIRNSEVIKNDHEYSNLVSVPVGANGGLSQYPFGSVSNQKEGVAIGNDLNWPTVSRIFYSSSRKQLIIAWDFALSAKASHGQAHFHCFVYRLPVATAKWGFRAAAEGYYKLFPAEFAKRTKKDGIWMPFTAPSNVTNAADFGFRFHEGDNSIESDHKLGILSFRYTEPMSYWMAMAAKEPRTYENALRLLKLNAESADLHTRDNARAALNSASSASDGRLKLQFRKEPWCDGALFVLNPSPLLPATAVQPTKSYINYNKPYADKAYGDTNSLDGEYLDSLEGWGDSLDYRASHLTASEYPLCFDTQRRPVLPQWFSTFAFTRMLSKDLHSRSKLLMANSTPVMYSAFSGQLDLMGIETNWLWQDGTWHPDDDSVFNLRRTMSYQKPYLLLQNTDFKKFTPDMVRRYIERSMFYGVFPSMFSVDAANDPYWENPSLYNRDRPIFKLYIPVIQKLSEAGWQPITHAVTTNRQLYVERYGNRFFTVFNNSLQPKKAELVIDAIKLPLHGGYSLKDAVTGEDIPNTIKQNMMRIPLDLEPERCRVLELVKN